MASLQKHFSYEIKGVKELENLIKSKPTQLRSEHSKNIHNIFYSEILPKIETLDKKSYVKLVKDLSKSYRSKTTPEKVADSVSVPVSPIKKAVIEHPSESSEDDGDEQPKIIPQQKSIKKKPIFGRLNNSKCSVDIQDAIQALKSYIHQNQ